MRNVYVTRKKNGFTLIELLAVIVILAIILLISVPEILKTLDQSKSSALQSSADLVSDSLTKQILIDETVTLDEKVIKTPLITGTKRCLVGTELEAMDLTSGDYVTEGENCPWVCRHTSGKVIVKLTASTTGKFFSSNSAQNTKISPSNLEGYFNENCKVAGS